jgi:MFS family permease
VTIFIPLFAVVVMGTDATRAGLLLAPVSVGLFISAFWVGRRIALTGHYRSWPPLGMALYAATLALCMQLRPDTPLAVFAFLSLLLGVGSGPMSPVVVISLQNAVAARDVGAASALASFSRQIGQSLGTAVLGALMAARLTVHLGRLAPAEEQGGLSARALADGVELIRSLPAELRADVIEAFRRAIADGWCAMIGVILLAGAILLRLPQVHLATRLGESAATQVD